MAKKASQFDLQAALLDPKEFFAEPQEVIDASYLSPDDKLAILRQWRLDAMRLADSDWEGMGGGEPAMLGRVENAILTLEGAGRAAR